MEGVIPGYETFQRGIAIEISPEHHEHDAQQQGHKESAYRRLGKETKYTKESVGRME